MGQCPFYGTLISSSRQTPAETARPRTWGRCVT